MNCCVLSDTDDGERCDCYTQSTRRARKPHTCCECREDIPAGANYEYVSGIWDGHPESYKTCASCVEIRDHFAKGCGGRWLFGYVWEDIEQNLFPTMKAGGPCLEGLSPEAKGRLFERRLKWLEERHAS